MVYACSTRLSQLSSAAPPIILHSTQLWCFLSISLPPQEARGLCLREASLQARNDAGVAKGPLAAWESKASLLMTKVTGDCGDMLKAPRILSTVPTGCAPTTGWPVRCPQNTTVKITAFDSD